MIYCVRLKRVRQFDHSTERSPQCVNVLRRIVTDRLRHAVTDAERSVPCAVTRRRSRSMCLEWLTSTIACYARGEILTRESDTRLVRSNRIRSIRTPGLPMMRNRRPERGGTTSVR